MGLDTDVQNVTAADKTHPNDEHTLADKRELSCHPDLGQDHLAAVPQDLLIAELLTGQRRLERTQ